MQKKSNMTKVDRRKDNGGKRSNSGRKKGKYETDTISIRVRLHLKSKIKKACVEIKEKFEREDDVKQS